MIKISSIGRNLNFMTICYDGFIVIIIRVIMEKKESFALFIVVIYAPVNVIAIVFILLQVISSVLVPLKPPFEP